MTTARDHWAQAVAARAAAHWTPTRTDEFLRGKAVAVRPAEGAVLLRGLGIADDHGVIPPQRVGKYFQVNHMVATVAPALAELRARHPALGIVDAGCGRSYLTTVLAWCGAHVWAHRIDVLGVDRNAAVIAESQRRVDAIGLTERVRYVAGDLARADVAAAWTAAFPDGAIHAVVALHACDTATCAAIALGVELDAALIAVAPCCQAELAQGWRALTDAGAAGALAPLWGAPHLRRETAAHVTDLMRLLLLRARGYQATALEFVPHEHTRKNTLLRAIRGLSPDREAARQYQALVDATGGVGLGLAARLAL
ncbi:MAG: SAM-dependent methyltransferase [Myxococcales bacterium]|nr:SAM-dependent methyltransferase [Myxococcales bacterium]